MNGKKSDGKKRHFNLKLLNHFLKGSWKYLLLGALFMAIAVLASYVKPFVVSYTVDYVIGNKTDTDMPQFFRNWLEAVGGRDCIVKNFIL